eukprot:COSAG02_NODE_24840_length_676_cov_0.996534_3_plen_56_part_01
MVRRLRSLLLALTWGALDICLSAAIGPPPIDADWLKALPGEDDIFKSCDYTTRFRI